MNRGPFLHGMLRFSNVRNKDNRPYKPVSTARKIVNLICFVLGLAIIIATIALGLTKVFLVGAVFFFGVASVPLLMSIGKNMVIYEKEIAVNQKRAELPLVFDKRKVLFGYILMFAPLYILMMGCFFIPVENAWAVPYIPLFVFTLISAMLTAHTIDAFEFSMSKYKFVHTFLYIFIIVVGFFVRGLIIFPYLNSQ